MHSAPLNDEFQGVVVEGEIDIATAPRFKAVLLELIARGHVNLVLNFNGVRYIDSTGLGVLLGALKRVREKEGRILLVCSSVRIQKLFAITGLSKVFDIFGTEEELRKKLKVD
ncbi:MAG: STAS domain-containing protein [Candidatus Xenobia bacterium]